jgi:hypothetical protein
LLAHTPINQQRAYGTENFLHFAKFSRDGWRVKALSTPALSGAKATGLAEIAGREATQRGIVIELNGDAG